MRFSGRFADRTEAGRKLAQELLTRKFENPVVLALPRGGVPVAVEIARALNAPLDLVFVRKIGVPFQPELAAAAVVDGGNPEVVVNDDVVAMAGVTKAEIDSQVKIELAEIERRRLVYLEGRARAPLDGRVLILVDDGIATGAGVRAAIAALRRKAPKKLILAVPVAPRETVEALRGKVDEVVCLEMPETFHAIGLHYRNFRQVPDEEVVRLLRAVDSGRQGDTEPGFAAAGEVRES
jgi:putative phosphoribosyl transferase